MAASQVALLAEGVDRNRDAPLTVEADLAVALLAEGVDRNLKVDIRHFYDSMSPSSRRAWIEIMSPLSLTGLELVALLAEGVDRNSFSFS